MVIAVILLLGAGYLSYRNITSIVSSIKVDEKPELILLSIRDISMDLQKAENSIRIYSVTNDTRDLQPYYSVISNIDEKVERLRSECITDSLLLHQTDTISTLIEENIVIWNGLLYLKNNGNVTGYLKFLSDRLNNEPDTVLKKEKGILRRVFSRNEKSGMDEEELKSDLQQMEAQERLAREKIMKRESQLATTGNEIKEQFYDLITEMENKTFGLIDSKASEAQALASKTFFWLAMFSISGVVLAILVVFIIIRYVRKTFAYQTALQNSKDEAEKLAKAKELFMANMSHEIRTPVTAISGFTEQLLHESSDGSLTSSLKIIKSSSDHLLKIIDDILDFSKLQNEKLSLEKVHFNLKQILEDVYGMFVKQAQQNDTRLSYSLNPETPAVLIGDPYRLRQIITNLVSNSIKFTSKGSVRYDITSFQNYAGSIDLIMEFTDTGIGIDESKLSSIFQDFTQEEMSTTRKYGGTGLGLSIVKNLIELHHGTIDVHSKKNRGTTIVCRIPYLTGDEKLIKQEAIPSLQVPGELPGMKILIVDDEEYNRMLTRRILERWSVEVYEAVNGIEALEMLKERHYDLLLMDIRMPGIDGLRATQIIREEMKIKEADMPIIIFSAAPVKEEWHTYRSAGMNAFLQKPFTGEMLLSAINEVRGKSPQINTFTRGHTGKEEPRITAGINLNNLYHISDGNQDFVKQMLVTFIASTGAGLKEMREAVSVEDFNSAADLAHKMLSPCRHLGALELFNLLNQIEKSARNNAFTGSVESLADKSLKEFEAVSELITKHISEMK